MSLVQDDHAFELLDALVAESPADETEVTLECSEERFVRFGPGGPTQSADRERYELAIRARYAAPDGGFREARATCGTLDRSEARAALHRAATLARLVPPTRDAPPLGGHVELPGTAPLRPTQDHTIREKAAWVDRVLGHTEAADLLAAGLVRTLVANRTLVNSAGRRVHAARSRASFQVVARDAPGGRGGVGAAAVLDADVDRIDPDAVAAEAVAAAVGARDPRIVAPREWTVVLAPRAVAALLAAVDFGAESYVAGRSFLCGRVGERMFPYALRLTEEPGAMGSTGWVLDGEGAPVRRMELLADGRLTGPLTDELWAARLGCTSTGHAPARPSAAAPAAQHLALESGPLTDEELVADIEHGLLVSSFDGLAVEDPRDLVLTGTTRHGTFLVRDGRVQGAVHDLRFHQSLVDALTRVTGVGAREERVAGLGDAECRVPALKIEGFRFTEARVR